MLISSRTVNTDETRPILLNITYIIHINVIISRAHITYLTIIVQDPDRGNNLIECGDNINAK